MKREFLRGLCLLALLGTMQGVSATTVQSVQLAPTADGHVRIFGGEVVDTTSTALSFFQSGGNIDNAVLEFDLSGINALAINSASLAITLTRFVSNVGSNPAAVDIFAYTGDGIVDINDYAAPGTQVVDTTTPAGGVAGDVRSFSFTDVAPIESALFANGLLTLRLESDNFASLVFASLENTGFGAASLSIDYTPVPLPAAWLMMLPAVVALGRRRRA